MDYHIEAAAERDLPAIVNLVTQLAIYEHLEHQMVATEEHFRQALFGPAPVARAFLAFVDGAPVGFALFYQTFSTFLGKTGLYLEDLFVEPHHRGKGIGSALLRRVAKLAVDENCGRMEWAVLTWNQPSIDFYHRLGAVTLEEWRTMRLTGDTLTKAGRRD